jgi:hypothetical protein
MITKRRRMSAESAKQKKADRNANGECLTLTSVDVNNANIIDVDGPDCTHHKSHYALTLLSKLNSMRDDQSLCDYEIHVNNHRFNVHKCILIAVSDFFKVMLTGTPNALYLTKTNSKQEQKKSCKIKNSV